MSFRLVLQSVTLNDIMAVTLRYVIEFGKHAFQHIIVLICGRTCTNLLYFVVCVRCRRKESSCSISHLLMSFLCYFQFLGVL